MRTLLALSALLAAAPLAAQRPSLSPTVRLYVQVDTPTIAFVHARVIDGTGAPARTNQTVLVQNGRITALGDDARVTIPASAQTLDLTGKTLIPGLAMVHEHLYYPTGPGIYGDLIESFTRLYLAGGVTSMRTGGNMNGYGELNIKTSIDNGQRAGPWIDASAPYMEGKGLGLLQVHELKDAAEARRMVDFWADMGATSLKAYMHITRDELKAVIDEGHKRGLKVTGHLCSVTFHEAAALGIDDLEHTFFPATDFVKDKKPDVCPGQAQGQASIAALDPNGPEIKELIQDLVQHHVALTSTQTVFETFTPGRPMPPGLDVLDPILREQFERLYKAIQANPQSLYAKLFPKVQQMEVAFYRAGGMLLAGTDPTGGGGVIPGYSDQREVELLVESGLTPLEAIKVCTLNGATYLGRGAITGSIERGKLADLVVIDGDPSTNIADIRKVALVFKQGVGYDPAKLIASVRGRVGLY